MQTQINQVIKGYELLERIGSGGFGAVYRANQSTVGREVAIKIILPGLARQPDFIRRFEAEAHLVARLEHMNIVPLYDYWRDPDGAYLVMRWLRGGSLRDQLNNGGAISIETAGHLLTQVASALSTAHEHNVIHRDIKPANILLDEEGNGYLADFGIAKDYTNLDGSVTGGDAVVGSLDYMSPEQARSQPATPRTDVYSLGVVLFEMLAGEHPFPNASSVERMYKHINDPLPTLPNQSDRINDIIRNATAKNPDDRYADALTFAKAFREAAGLEHEPVPERLVEILTPREQEVLQLMLDGLSNNDIAEQLVLTINTVRWYLKQIYGKLHVRNRAQAIVRARELDLVFGGNGGTEDSTVVGGSTSVMAALPEPENPYKGLQPFQSADSQDYFGRQRIIKRLVERIGESDGWARFLAIIGPSGSGKSSLVKAGLIPALWRGELPGSDRWFVAEMIPGAHPLDELEVALRRVSAHPGRLKDDLESDVRGLLRASQLILPDDGSELLLVIDQFEEVFTLVEDEAVREHFIDLIYTATSDPRSNLHVVITLRADFFDRPLRYPEFGEMLRARMETILPLSPEELEQAIMGPARRVGVTFEDGLVANIVGDVNYQPGALPLLQYALTELFNQREQRTLTHNAYQKMGGTIGALAKRADQIYLEFDVDGQQAIRQMFLRLVTLGEGSEDTRRRVVRSELLGLVEDTDLMDDIIDTFDSYRLLSLDHDPASRRPTIEVAHEAILREWEQLRQWLNESRGEIRLQNQLSEAAQQWADSAHDLSFLAHGTRLEQFENWLTESTLLLTQQERAYVDASLAERSEQIKREELRQQREVHLEIRSQRLLKMLVGVFAVATLIGVTVSIFALNSQNQAVEERDLAEQYASQLRSLALMDAAKTAAASGDTILGLSLGLEAIQIENAPPSVQGDLMTIASQPGLRHVFEGHQGAVLDVAFSPEADLALTASADGTVILWDTRSGDEIRVLEGHNGEVTSVAFAPDGQFAVSGSDDHALIIWNVTSGEIVHRLEGHGDTVRDVAFSANGRIIASASRDASIILWDVTSGQPIRTLAGHDGDVRTIDISPDGQWIVSGSSDKTMLLWDVQSGEAVGSFAIPPLPGHPGLVRSVAFSQNSKQVAAVSGEDIVRIWDREAGDIIAELRGHEAGITTLDFGSRGTLVSADRDGTLIIWDLERGEPKFVYSTSQQAAAVTMSDDGDFVLLGSEDGSARIYTMSEDKHAFEVRRFGEVESLVFGARFSPDGDQILVGGGPVFTVQELPDATESFVIQLDAETGEAIQHLEGHAATVTSITYSPDGKNAATTSGDNSLILWDVASGEILQMLIGHQGAVWDAEYSPDGNYIASGSDDSVVIIWDVDTGKISNRLEGHTDAVLSITFSPDGSRIVSGGDGLDQTIILWDAFEGTEIRRLEGHAGCIYDLEISSDGKSLLSGSCDGTISLWDVETGQMLRRFEGHGETVKAVAFSPDGRIALSAGNDGTNILWDVGTGNILYRFNIERFPWFTTFAPNGQTALAPTGDLTGRLVTLAVGPEAVADWISQNRSVRPLTEEECQLYREISTCDDAISGSKVRM